MVDRRDRERRDSFESLMAKLSSRTLPPVAPNIPSPSMDPLTDALLQTDVNFPMAARLTEQRIKEAQAHARPDLRAAHDAVELFEGIGVPDILRAWNDQVLEGKGNVTAQTWTDDSLRYKLRTTQSIHVDAPDLIAEDPREQIIGNSYKVREAITGGEDGHIIDYHTVDKTDLSYRVTGAHTVFAREGVDIIFNGGKVAPSRFHRDSHLDLYDFYELLIEDKSVPPPSHLQIPHLLPFAGNRVFIGTDANRYISHFRAHLSVVDPINEEGIELMRYFINATLAYLSIPRLKDPLSERVRRAEEELAKFRSKIGTFVEGSVPLEVISLRKPN